jgi:hypothetical protein
MTAEMDHKKYLSMIGTLGGKATKGISTEAKADAARKNGKKGGRPRDKKPSAAALAQRRSRARRGKAN